MLQNYFNQKNKPTAQVASIVTIIAWFGIALFLAIFLLTNFLSISFVSDLFNRLVPSDFVYGLMIMVATWILSLAIYVYLPTVMDFAPKFKALMATSWGEVGIKSWPKWRDIFWPISGFIVYMILTIGLSQLADKVIPWYDLYQKQDLGFDISLATTILDRFALFLMLVILAPVAEEVMFRGVIYGKLRKVSTAVVSTLLVSLVFGLAHMSWNVGVDTFALSIVLCIMREASESIYPAIVLHVIKNSIALVALFYI